LKKTGQIPCFQKALNVFEKQAEYYITQRYYYVIKHFTVSDATAWQILLEIALTVKR